MNKDKSASFIDSVIIPNTEPRLLEYTLDWIRDNLYPIDVFNQEDLEAWAESNGFEPTR